MQKVLITGANGLLGSHLVPLLKEEYELHLLQRSSVAPGQRHVTFQQVDLGGNELPELPAAMDAIVYLAQSENYRQFPESAPDVLQVNTVQVLRMLDYGRRAGVKKFIFASTGGVYPAGDNLREDVPIEASGKMGFYATTKMCSEMLAHNFSSFFDVILLRFFFIYGKGQKSYMLMPRLVDSVRTEKAIRLAGESGLHINPIHATDAASAVHAALKLEGSHTINVAGPEVISLREIAEMIGEKINKKPIFEQEAAGAEPRLVANIDAMTKHLVKPAVKFNQGVLDLL